MASTVLRAGSEPATTVGRSLPAGAAADEGVGWIVPGLPCNTPETKGTRPGNRPVLRSQEYPLGDPARSGAVGRRARRPVRSVLKGVVDVLERRRGTEVPQGQRREERRCAVLRPARRDAALHR